jgi:cobalt-zinc-cadmium efflux system protein
MAHSHHDHSHHGHNHDHSHSHNHAQGASATALTWAVVLTGGFMFAEFIGGLLSGSLALIADAGHMLNDSLALAFALFALRLARKPANRQKTFGYKRSETLMAFVNGLSLTAVAVLILREAVVRLFAPGEIHSETMLGIAVLGALINIGVAWLLFRHSQGSLNIRGAFLHVLSDLMGSVGAIVAALIIQFTGWLYADAVVSILISGLILRHSIGFLRETSHILLEGAPPHLDLEALEQGILALDSVQGLHDLHVWTLNGGEVLLTAHLQIADLTQATAITAEVQHYLEHNFGIHHATLQVETAPDCGPCVFNTGPLRLSAERHTGGL